MTPAHAESFPWHQKLPRLGTEQEFADLRALLAACDYSYEGICRHIKVADLAQYKTGPVAELIGKTTKSPAEAMIRLFLDCVYTREDELQRVLPEGGLETLWSFELIARNPELPGLLFATAAILPVSTELTVCDRGNAPDGERCPLPPDVVYPAIFENTREFIGRLPQTPCEAMLDLGTGTGIAALQGARSAQHVWASDISTRCQHFAEFNRRLAGLSNLTVVLGDMYQPFAGQTFDRIVTHPPYIPAKETGIIFRDGGEDGEQIVRRAIEGLPGVLRPGGCFYSLQMATDREGEEFEQRIRRWLGKDQAQFDVILVSRWLRTPEQMLVEKPTRHAPNEEEQRFRSAMWKATRTTFIYYGWVLIRRHYGGRPPATGRMQSGNQFTGRAMEWLLEWESAAAAPHGIEMLFECRPSISPHCLLKTIHRVHEGRFMSGECLLEANHVFDSTLPCPGWVAQVVSECDGVKTWREHFVAARESGLIDSAEPPEEFANGLRNLVAGGILQLAAWPLPE
ncbi:MAG: methyltransferase [Candidatus Solibacter sp.]